MSKHTPGPWMHDKECVWGPLRQHPQTHTDPELKGAGITTRTKICVLGYPNDSERTANARLIAAAPDLLRELEALLWNFNEAIAHDPIYMELGNDARAAIAKAKDES